jgi:peptidase M28-like protein
MINLDMIGHPHDAATPTIVVERDMGNEQSGNDAASQAAADRMAKAATIYTPLNVQLGPIYDSDYMPFEHFGYVCIGAFDAADDQPFYHSVTDTPDKVNSAFHADVVRMVLATVVADAGH